MNNRRNSMAHGIWLAAFLRCATLCGAVPENVPELLETFSGQKIETREQWETVRAPELLEEFTREEYGRRPVERPASLTFSALEPDKAMMDPMDADWTGTFFRPSNSYSLVMRTFSFLELSW